MLKVNSLIEEESSKNKERISGNRAIDVYILSECLMGCYALCVNAVHLFFIKDMRKNKDYH